MVMAMETATATATAMAMATVPTVRALPARVPGARVVTASFRQTELEPGPVTETEMAKA